MSEGTYVVVTAGYDTYTSGFYLNQMVDQNGDILESWDGELLASYWDGGTGECDIAWPEDPFHAAIYAFVAEYELEYGSMVGCFYDEEDGYDDQTYVDVAYELEDNWTHDGSALDYAQDWVETNASEYGQESFDLYEEFRIYDDGLGRGVESIVEGDDRAHIPHAYQFEEGEDGDDPHWDLYMDFLDTIASYQDGTSTPAEAADKIVELVHQADAMGLYDEGGDDGDCYDEDGNMVDCYDDEGGRDDCPFSDDDFCYEVGLYCDSESPDYDPEYCGAESAHYCLEDGADDEGCAEIDEIVADCDAGEAPQEICDAFLNFDHDAYHADHDDDDHARLDGIIGVEDPPNNDPDISPTNLVGALSDNEGLPMMYAGQFTLTFEGADASLDMHEFYIPIDDGTWNVEMILLDGYEALSCDGCDSFEVTETGAMLSSGAPVTVTFGKAAPGPDCDYVVGIDSTGYAFDPVELTINVGETVCWQWADTSDAHNVVEINAEYDTEMNVADVSVGFTSGDASNNMDFRHTFTEDDKTHYYVCEPHAAMGMVGKITVGEGTPEDPVEEIEESGLPSVGFIVGALVLVGAAGLRRRH
ncbi:MAG TPA: hypothetical protein EYO72_03370 [Marine Group III euryarchaeote]|nr:hypothetical protein [Marine Group III euryarchaeote]